MLDVMEFIEARLDDDEKAALDAADAGVPVTHTSLRAFGDIVAKEYLLHALRGAVERKDEILAHSLHHTLRLFTQAYIGHPDFRSEWLIGSLVED